jgi:chaperonin GroEL
MKKIFFDQEARNRILEGAGILYRAVKTTMSPLGRNVVIKRPYGHTITHDGVTVAENIEVDNLELAVGADIIKEAAGKLNNEVGDGTTTVTVLTYNLMEQAEHLIREGMNPMQVRAELEKVKYFLLGKLDDKVVELDDEKLIDVATISAGNAELGELIGKLALEVGKDGSIVVERGSGYKDEVVISDGFTFERTYLSPYFITDKRKQAAVLENPAIIISNEKLKTYSQVQALIDQVGDVKSVLLICDELSGEALSTIVQSHTRGLMQFAAVQAPSFGDARRELLEDIAAVTEGQVFDEAGGKAGHAEQVVISRDTTTIIGGAGNPEHRIEMLGSRELESDYETEQMEKRIANMAGKVGTIKVGGASESEADEKKYRVDDAVAAVKAAQTGGIVAGGGVTLVNLAEDLTGFNNVSSKVKRVVQHSLKMPFATILQNADLWEDNALDSVSMKTGVGVNVMKPHEGLVNMIEAGVIDPAKVTRQVLEAAFSIAMTAITVDVLVVDVPDEV